MLPFLEKLPSPLANFVPDGQRSSPLISVSLQNISLHIKQDHSGTSLILKTDLKTSICADKISCASFRSTETVLFSGGVLCANECASIQLKVFSLQKLPAARSPCSVLPVMHPPQRREAALCPWDPARLLQSGTLLQEKLVMKVTLNIFLITCLHPVPENPVLYEIQGPDVTSGWSHKGFFKLVTKHSSENETTLGESSVGSTLILKFN